MSKSGFFSPTRIVAIFVLLPLALGMLGLAGWFAAESQRIQKDWLSVQAVVVDVSRSDSVGVDLTLPSGSYRHDLGRDVWLNDVVENDLIPLYVNPNDPTDIRRANFGDLWLTSAFFGVFALILGSIAAFMVCSGDDDADEIFEPSAEFRAALRDPGRRQAAPLPEDDGLPIVLHEPRQSWKANVFWGLLFGLLLFVPPLFAPADADPLQKYGQMVAGLAWMLFMGRQAIRNSGKTVRIDNQEIVVATPLGVSRIPLSQVERMSFSDVRQELADLENIGLPRYKSRPMNTMGRLKLYTLYDATGRVLLRLDRDMTPASGMERFLNRMAHVTHERAGH